MGMPLDTWPAGMLADQNRLAKADATALNQGNKWCGGLQRGSPAAQLHACHMHGCYYSFKGRP